MFEIYDMEDLLATLIVAFELQESWAKAYMVKCGVELMVKEG